MNENVQNDIYSWLRVSMLSKMRGNEIERIFHHIVGNECFGVSLHDLVE